MSKTNLRDKIDYLNSLRGIAVLMVVFTHAGLYTNTAGLGDVMRGIVGDASRGVQLFYILSAFTLFYSLHARSGEDRNRWTDFFIRRLFRIAPLWWLSIAVFLHLRNQYTFSVQNILSNAFFIHGFNPCYINSIVVGGWSIAVEMTFYLLVPVFYRLCSNVSKSVIWFTWIYAASRALTLWMAHWHLGYSDQVWSEFTFFCLPHQLPVFFLGFILFHLVIRKDTAISKVALVHAAIFLIFCYSFSKDWFMEQCALLFPLVWIVSAAPIKLWNNRLLQYLGKVSFSLYLVHFAAVMLVNKTEFVSLFQSSYAQLAIGFPLVVLFATGMSILTFNLVEKPGIKLGNRLIEALEARSRSRNTNAVQVPMPGSVH